MINFIDEARDRIELGLIGLSLWTKRNIIEPVRDSIDNEDGDIVQTVIILALFAILAVAVVNVIGKAVSNQANNAVNTIDNANVVRP